MSRLGEQSREKNKREKRKEGRKGSQMDTNSIGEHCKGPFIQSGQKAKWARCGDDMSPPTTPSLG